MESNRRKTIVLPEDTREQRRQELERFLQVPDGVNLLASIYHEKVHRIDGIPPAGPVMIEGILDQEFPEE